MGKPYVTDGVEKQLNSYGDRIDKDPDYIYKTVSVGVIQGIINNLVINDPSIREQEREKEFWSKVVFALEVIMNDMEEFIKEVR